MAPSLNELINVGQNWFPKTPSPAFDPPDSLLLDIGLTSSAMNSMSGRALLRQLVQTSPDLDAELLVPHFAAMERLLEDNCPTYWVEPKAVADCLNGTNLDSETGDSLRTVVPSGLFGLGQNVPLRMVYGISHIAFGMFETNTRVESRLFGKGTGNHDRFLVAVGYDNGINVFGGILFLSAKTLSESLLGFDRDDSTTVVLAPQVKDTFEFILRMFVWMQRYPEYIQNAVGDTDRRSQMVGNRKPRIYRVARPLVRDVPLEPRIALASFCAATKKAPHVRRGHWTRRPHSEIWELAHPDREVIALPDGRRAHMVWIEPINVNKHRLRAGGSSPEGSA